MLLAKSAWERVEPETAASLVRMVREDTGVLDAPATEGIRRELLCGAKVMLRRGNRLFVGTPDEAHAKLVG